MDKIVAIHQPNFFPWLGYFDKINKSDIFIFLDDVQFPKKGGNWTNRVQLMVFGSPKWMTSTIERDYSGTKNINEIKINTKDNWKHKFFKTLDQSYKKYPFHSQIIPTIEQLVFNEEQNLSKYNINTIKVILDHLEIDSKKLRLSSELKQEGSSNQLLINLTKSLSCNIYMCGGGADGYQTKELFEKNNVKLLHQEFVHPKYNQQKQQEFVKGLSIIDCLMNIGWEETSYIIKNV
jgi:hypothetical protein